MKIKMKSTLLKPKIALGASMYAYQNLLMIIGLILSFSGGSWDITFHILSQPETFFSYPHSLVYSGILLIISTFFLNIRRNFNTEKMLKKNYIIIFAGIILILAAGPFDFYWHLKFGLDGLLSPPHLTLLTGWSLIAIGNLRITNFKLTPGIFDNIHPMTSHIGIQGDDIEKNGYIKNWKLDGESINVIKKKRRERDIVLKIQLFLNLSILLMILSGLLYFFSLPFSETQSYNFNPPSDFAFFIYGLGFPILFSAYFIKVFEKYSNLSILVFLIGSFYIVLTLFTQILSNPFLYGLWGYYILNLIPFGAFYVVNKSFRIGRFSKKSKKIQHNDLAINFPSAKFFRKIILGIIFALLSYSLCFPLNTYILNEELYGYLIYQNLIVKIYLMIFLDNFMIILPLSVIGGVIGSFISISKPYSSFTSK